jgi:predicted ATPase
MKRYILTGTPGSGKTTVIHALKRKGYAVVEEAATDVITLEQSNGILEPWTHPSFIHTILQLQIHREHQAIEAPIQFFDRSPICTYALCTFLNYPIPVQLTQKINRITTAHVFQQNVFFLENLGCIQPTDARKISFKDALRFEKIHKDVYQYFGYTLIILPHTSEDNRLHKTLTWID